MRVASPGEPWSGGWFGGRGSRRRLLGFIGIFIIAVLGSAVGFIGAVMAEPSGDRTFVIRPDLLFLRAPVRIDQCMNADGVLESWEDEAVTGFRPLLHEGHRYSLRLARWASINQGIEEEAGDDYTDTVRAQIYFQVFSGGDTYPLLFDEIRHIYYPGCSADTTVVDVPNEYPTVILRLSASPDAMESPGEASETEDARGGEARAAEQLAQARRSLTERLRARLVLNFLPAEEGDGDGDVGAAMISVDELPSERPLRFAQLVEATFSRGAAAFLDGWPGDVTVSLDGVGDVPALAALTIGYQGEKAGEGEGIGTNGRSGAGATQPADGTTVGARPVELLVVVPEVFAEIDLSTAIQTLDGGCDAEWQRLKSDPRAYTVRCDEHPPYRFRIGRTRPLRAYHNNRIVRSEELILDLTVPLAQDWPDEIFPRGVATLSGLTIDEFLADGGRIAMFPDGSRRGDEDAACVARIPGDIRYVLTGYDKVIPAPCEERRVDIPEAWRLRIGGRQYPVVGCLRRGEDATCLAPRHADATVGFDFGPGWQRFDLPLERVNRRVLAENLRPQWPYDADLIAGVPQGHEAPTYGVFSVAYCWDTRGARCCGRGPVMLDGIPADQIELLPSLAQAGCRPDQPLPYFAIAEFDRINVPSVRNRFGRYWTITAISSRPYRISWHEVNKLYPIRILHEAPQKDGLRVELYASLYNCQKSLSGSHGVESFPLRSDQDYQIEIGLPVFAVIKDDAGVRSRCAEGVLDPVDPKTVEFRFVSADSPTED